MKPFLLPFLLFSMILAGCSTKEAEKVADEFHQRLDSGDHGYIVENLADLENDVTEHDWYDFLELVESWGPQKNRQKQMGFNKKYTNGVTTVKLSYQAEIDEVGTVYERIVLVDRDGTYKILTVVINSDESVVEEQTKDF